MCTADDIQQLFGLHIASGVLKYPQIKNVLGEQFENWNFHSDRFFQLRSNLHMVNVLEDHDPNDRIWKFRLMFDAVRSRCLELDLEQQLWVDEQIIPFHGRPIIYKTVCEGVKLFVLSGKSGQC